MDNFVVLQGVVCEVQVVIDQQLEHFQMHHESFVVPSVRIPEFLHFQYKEHALVFELHQF